MEESLGLRDRLMRLAQSTLCVAFIYFALPYLFFAAGYNIWNVGLAPGDAYVGGIPYKVFNSNIPLWNPYLLSGTFNIKDIGVQALYLPAILIMKAFPNPFGYNLLLLLHYSMAGFFTFLFLRALKLHGLAAFIGGLTFMFCGFMSAHKGHTSMIMTAAYLPLVLYFAEKYLVSRSLHWLLLSGLAFGVSILADYTALSLYIGMVLCPYVLFRMLSGAEHAGESLWKKLFASIGYIAVICGLGLLLASPEILPIIESLPYINRATVSYSFFASYSFSFGLLPLLVFPFIFGASFPAFYQPAYFGPWNLTEMAGYMGILPVTFAILAIVLFRKKNTQVYFWAAVALAGFILALGDSLPLNQLMYHVPVYNLFRAPARNWMEVNFAVMVLSAIFVHIVITMPEVPERSYYRSTSILIGLLIGAVLFTLVFYKDFIVLPNVRNLWIENSKITSHAVLIPLIIVGVSSVALFVLVRYRSSRAFWSVLAAFIFMDLFSFGYFQDASYRPYEFFQKGTNSLATFLDRQGQDKTQYRLFPLYHQESTVEPELGPNINMLYGFSLINGYVNIWLKDYLLLTTFELNGFTSQRYRLLANPRILSVLSTRYIVTSDPIEKQVIQSLRMDGSSTQSSLLVDGFHTPGWAFVSAKRSTDQSATLQSESADKISAIRIPFSIQPKTLYKIAFQARRIGTQSSDAPLFIDFVGNNYYGSGQRTEIDASLFLNDFTDFETVIYSGQNTPPSAYLRLFTVSQIPYEIQNVRLYQLSGAGRSPLYIKESELPGGIAVYENPNFLPRARLIDNIRLVETSSAAIRALWFDDSLDPSKTALVQGYNGETEFDPGIVLHADYSHTDKVDLAVKTGNRGFLVLSDSWYPGWRAFVDGKETPIYKTNAVSRSIVVEGAGAHQVEFRFVPTSFYVGLGIASLTLILSLLGIAYSQRQKALPSR